MMKNFLGRLGEIGITFVVLAGCLFHSEEKKLSGVGIETGNTISGRVVGAGNESVPGVLVHLIPDDWNPVISHPDSGLPTTLTDEKGRYRFTKVDTGHYTISASAPGSGTIGALFGVHHADTGSLVLQNLALESGRTLSFPLPFIAQDSGYIFIEGTLISKRVHPGDSLVVVEGIPSGRLPDAHIVDVDDEGTRLLFSDINTGSIEPGGKLEVPSTNRLYYQYRAVIRIPEAESAGMEQVTGYPLLVKLSGKNFDFSKSKRNGEGLAFYSRSKVIYPHEIEKFDSLNGEAVIWVKLDTLNPRSPPIVYFSNSYPSGTDTIRAPVFDEANGFGGVWHLNQEASGTTEDGVYLNSTRSRDHGNDRISNADQTGIIGSGHYFGGFDYVQVPSPSDPIKPRYSVTLSAWVRADSSNQGMKSIINFGTGYALNLDVAAGLEFCMTFGQRVERLSLNAALKDSNLSAWKHISAVYNGKTMSLFLDGILLGSRPVSGELDYPGWEHPDYPGVARLDELLIGKKALAITEKGFEGLIDEVRVCHVSRSNTWIRLGYLTQRPGAAIISILK